MNQAMSKYIEACQTCHSTCLSMAMTHCLALGGKHVEAKHFRLMRDCAEMCQTSANFMLSDSQFQKQVCRLCADICDACARSCASIGDMKACVDACEQCASSCREMAAGG